MCSVFGRLLGGGGVLFIQTIGVIVSVFTLSVTDRGFESWTDQTKDYKISICYFSSKKGGV